MNLNFEILRVGCIKTSRKHASVLIRALDKREYLVIIRENFC